MAIVICPHARSCDSEASVANSTTPPYYHRIESVLYMKMKGTVDERSFAALIFSVIIYILTPLCTGECPPLRKKNESVLNEIMSSRC